MTRKLLAILGLVTVLAAVQAPASANAAPQQRPLVLAKSCVYC